MNNDKELDRCKEILIKYKLIILSKKYKDLNKIYNLSDEEYNFKKIDKKIIEFKEVI